MRKKFIAGNWKMYTTAAGAKSLAEGVAKGVTDDAVTVAVCPPYPWLGLVADALKGSNVAVGGQFLGRRDQRHRHATDENQKRAHGTISG